LISLTGNQLEKVDVVGGVAASSDASGSNEPVNIYAAYYDATADKTYFQVGSFSDTFTTGDDLYFSEDKFTNSGTWVTPSSGSYNHYIATPPDPSTGNGYQTIIVPYKSSYGLTTTASNFRVLAAITGPQSGVTYRIDTAIGTLESIS
jgi:hypothetical protein